MINSIIKLLRRHQYYRFIVIGALLSSIGSGLTQVAIFGTLNRLNASTMAFSFAFVLSVVPGLFSSHLGLHALERVRPVVLLALVELAGALSVLIPMTGAAFHNSALLQCAQFVSALLAGFVIPASNAIVSSYFSDEELPAVSGIGTYVFSANVLLGYGLGTLLFGFVTPNTYFIIDILSYLAGAVLIFRAYRGDQRLGIKPVASSNGFRQKIRWNQLSVTQKKAFLLLPALTLAGVPAVSLLPAIARDFGSQFTLGGVLIDSVMFFLFAKTLGQMIGPLCVKPESFDRLIESPRSFFFLVWGFGALYLLATQAPWISVAFGAVVLAHILSNVIYVVATYALPRYFKGDEAAIVSAKQYQIQVLLMAVCGLASGWLAEQKSVTFVIGVNLLISSVSIAWILRSRSE